MHALLPGKDSAMFNDSPIVAGIRLVSEDYLNTVAIEVEDSGIEVACVLVADSR
jgi:hypothetical protein